MKVLLVIPYLAPVYGGPSRVVQELASSLGELGITVDLITTNANGLGKLPVPLDVWIKQHAYRVQYFNCWHRNDLIISPSLIQWLYKNVRTYDIVHTHNRFAPLILLAEWACRFHKVPYVSTPHGMLEPWALSYKAWKKQIYYTLLEKPTLNYASAIHVLNSTEEINVQLLGLKQTEIIPNGVHFGACKNSLESDLFYQQFPQTQHKTIILFLGRIDPKKGLDLLASAFARVQQQFPETHLVVAGPDSINFLTVAQSYFDRAGCMEAVTFTGMLTGNVKSAALMAASVYVAPSYSEGFSMSILEGMASGLPCVITTGCNFSEAAAAGVAHVVDMNSDAIAAAMIQCLSMPEAAKEMGNRAREFIMQRYTWDQAAQKLIQVYEAVLAQKPLPN